MGGQVCGAGAARGNKKIAPLLEVCVAGMRLWAERQKRGAARRASGGGEGVSGGLTMEMELAHQVVHCSRVTPGRRGTGSSAKRWVQVSAIMAGRSAVCGCRGQGVSVLQVGWRRRAGTARCQR